MSERRRILLVDDDPLFLAMAADVLHDGFETRTASTLAEVRGALSGWRADLVLLDVRMPELSGGELCRWVKSQPETARTPVVLFSALPEDELARLAVACGADGHLSKRRPTGARPLVDELCERLQRIMGNMNMTDRAARILLVDDSPLTLECAQEALADAGYDVHGVNDLSALDEVEHTDFDLILMDVVMPEAYGDDIAAMLRGVRGLAAPIVLLSSLDERELAERAREAELDGYISKTVGMDGLVTQVRQILHARKHAS